MGDLRSERVSILLYLRKFLQALLAVMNIVTGERGTRSNW